ncbi:MAG TPA: YbaB/EbfC family nucleoid-associated protein [Saprospiraceae bacterium]|nr:YbaB/EbfC family nucleoid-associated protein [Saprospiraceae bacterium]
MFGDLMGNLEEQQNQMKAKLMQVVISESVQGITVSGNATKTIDSINIDESLFAEGDKEMLEELLLLCVNRFIEKAIQVEAEESQKLMETMLPPGFGDLFK